MAIIASKLIEKIKSLSPEEQEELIQQADETITNFLPSIAQQLLGSNESLLTIFNQHFQDSLKPPFNDLFKECFGESLKAPLGDFFKVSFDGFMQKSLGFGERYSEPSYIPPLFYPKQKPPQVISMYTVYLPVSNYMLPFLVILVKRKH
jgi:hypothetical protein